jgi:hypothetical protein
MSVKKIKNQLLSMKKIFSFLLCIFAALPIFATNNLKYTPKPEIQPYVAFLQTSQVTDPKEYIIKLFDTYDIVILAEADHRETTQWEFIYSLVSDPRFYSKVGNMFTEYGSVYLQPKLQAFLNAPTLNRKAILDMMHDFMPDQEGWDHNNFYDFLQRLYGLNQSLPQELKINLYFSDQPISWDEFIAPYPYTPNKYDVFYALPNQAPPSQSDFINPRDRIMAMRIYTKFQDLIKAKSPRAKALVIMNSRHGFGYLPQIDDPKNGFAYIGQNTAGYLMQWLPNTGTHKVANVMLHTATYHLLQDGKWDAAFLCTGNKAAGFDFKGNPFGYDQFDYGQIPTDWGKYQDIFTGIVFYEPLQNHFYCTNIKDFYDNAYKAIVKQRALSSCGEKCYEDIKIMWDDMEKNPEKYCGKAYDDTFLQPMYQWVDAKPE